MLAVNRRASAGERQGKGVMGLRELKETAHQQFMRGKFAQCAQTYHQILRLAPRDPNMRVRHAEACRRTGDRLQAIASYRAAADLLLEIGCESRARGALKAALELDPRDPLLLADIARLGPHHEETFSHGHSERDELPLLPPLEPAPEPAPPPAQRPMRTVRPEAPPRLPSLPPIHRALPSAPSVPPLVPPVLLPSPQVASAASGSSAARVEKMGAAMASAAGALAQPRAMPPPILQPRAGNQLVQPLATPAPASVPRIVSQTPTSLPVPPPPPREALEPSGAQAPRLEVRRLSPTTLAFRSSPHDRWALIRSHTPLELHLVEDLEELPPMLRDFAASATVESATEGAPRAMH
jgi:hypothetical protein